MISTVIGRLHRIVFSSCKRLTNSIKTIVASFNFVDGIVKDLRVFTKLTL